MNRANEDLVIPRISPIAREIRAEIRAELWTRLSEKARDEKRKLATSLLTLPAIFSPAEKSAITIGLLSGPATMAENFRRGLVDELAAIGQL